MALPFEARLVFFVFQKVNIPLVENKAGNLKACIITVADAFNFRVYVNHTNNAY
jgi:hypothetical protein